MKKTNAWFKIFSKKNNPYLIPSYNVKKGSNNSNYQKYSYKLSRVIFKSNKTFFKDYINLIIKKLDFDKKVKKKSDTSIAEYGSGNGFILYYLQNKLKLGNLHSYEIVKSYLDFQKKIIRNGKFNLIRPNNTSINLNNDAVNFFIISSVLQYITSLTQTKKILTELVRVSRNGILILDIYNSKTKKQYLSKKIKDLKMSLSEFHKKYKNTPYLYYDKKFFNFLYKNKKVKKLIYFNMPLSWKYRRYVFCLFVKLK